MLSEIINEGAKFGNIEFNVPWEKKLFVEFIFADFAQIRKISLFYP